MSNISFACLQSLCSFSFFKSHDLRKTSLNRTSHLQLDRNETTVARSNPEDSNRASHYSSKKEPETPNKGGKEKVSLTEKDFRIMQVVGAGKNWKTYMVRKEGDKCLYAMKLIGKKRMAKNSVTDQVIMEKEILEKARHPFIPKLAWYFENDKKVFLVTEFIEGAVTLSQVLKNLSRFSEEISRFYSAEILLTLEYLHRDLQVVYNDFKLRHILLDSQGHIKMIDFAQAKKLILPETLKEISQNGASFSIKEACVGELLDFWALGCIIYEMLTGKRPFCEDGEDNSDLDEMSPISQLSWPCSVSKNAKDLITRLLNRTVEDKLSFNSIEEIKKHAFFAQVNWEKMTSKSVYPPLIPSQLKDKLREDYDIEDEGLLESEQIRLKYSKPSSLEKILEGSSAFNSDEGIDAVSFDRTTCINSVLGYR